ncbi:MAG: hypothetical protein M3R57_08425 [Chloroflexota bacterium]|nr:hypothetical protein [Chloroflexota bacterium]
MSFLRRFLGGGGETNGATPPDGAADAADAAEAESLHERELMLAENERLDELRRRQLKYADRAWTPPAQGGERRSDDKLSDAEK